MEFERRGEAGERARPRLFGEAFELIDGLGIDDLLGFPAR